MSAPAVQAQSKTGKAYQKSLELEEGFEMKTATLTEKVNRWLHEHLAIKTPAKLLGGLALGALLAMAAALPFGGLTYADEPARPLSSEQSQCYPEDIILGWCYGFAATPGPALATDATISGVQILPEDAWRFDSPYYDDFLADVAASPSSINGLDEVWPEIDDTPVFHLLKQLKAGSPPSINGIRCYPEDNC